MFQYFRKRPADVAVEPASAPVQAPQSEQRAVLAAARQAAIEQAEALDGNEAAALDFILCCEFADARLKAAFQLQSKPMLEQVQQALRNTDRRVAKLMQTRLEELARQAASDQRATQCVDDAQRLMHEPSLTPNQVADLDRNWAAAGTVSGTFQQSFDSARAVLRQRLEAQAALQRALIDASASLRVMQAMAEAAEPAVLAQQLAELEQQVARYAGSPEIASLPKHLLPEFSDQLGSFKQSLQLREQHHAAWSVRQQAMNDWENAEPATLTADDIKRQWRALPVLHESGLAAPLQARLDALLLRVAASRKTVQAVVQQLQQDRHATQKHFSDALDALEKALQDGLLQAAAEHDKALRAIDVKAISLSDTQIARLSSARTELSNLQGWARWGGNVSREELLKVAEQLPSQALPVLELAKKVGSLRERWKSMDVSAGPAVKELWQRFDQACSAAYAPAAEHFRKLADERQRNAAKAQTIIAEARQFADAADIDAADHDRVDWKALAGFCERTAQAWQRLGIIDRKEKKHLDAEFDSALQRLSEPLARQRAAEVQRRESMITEAAALNPNMRGALEALRALQERWQQHARSLPLERKTEQALWQRFREACDAVFARRKEASVAADNERSQHLQKKEAWCSTLEAAVQGPSTAILSLLREAQQAWEKIGTVPRTAETRIEERYRQAVTALQKRLLEIQRAAAASEVSALSDKWKLCHAAEQLLNAQSIIEPGWLDRARSEWQALPALPAEFEASMQARFEAALAALQSGDRQYVVKLEKNRASLARELLRLEMVIGIDSPPELSRERLQLQVEALQSSLKTGQKPAALRSVTAQVFGLCSLPALADAQLAKRTERLFAHVHGSAA